MHCRLQRKTALSEKKEIWIIHITGAEQYEVYYECDSVKQAKKYAKVAMIDWLQTATLMLAADMLPRSTVS
jgi:hypothetical protein